MGTSNLSSGQARERLAPATAHALDTVTGLMKTVGPGSHALVAAVHPRNAEPVSAYAGFAVAGDGDDALWAGDFADAAAVTEVVALAFILAKGSVVLGTTSTAGKKTVRAWTVDGYTLKPLTAEEVQDTFKEAAGPEAEGVTYQAAFPVPTPAPA